MELGGSRATPVARRVAGPPHSAWLLRARRAPFSSSHVLVVSFMPLVVVPSLLALHARFIRTGTTAAETWANDFFPSSLPACVQSVGHAIRIFLPKHDARTP